LPLNNKQFQAEFIKPAFLFHRLGVVQNLFFECLIRRGSVGVRTLCSSIDYHGFHSYISQTVFIVVAVIMWQRVFIFLIHLLIMLT